MSERSDTMLQQIPPFMRRDPTVVAVNSVVAEELDRLEASMDELIDNFYPHKAEQFLKFWEKLFGIPVESPDKTLSQRRATVIAFLRRLSEGGSGANWEARITDLIGSDWTYAVHSPTDARGLTWARFLGALDADWAWVAGTDAAVTWRDPSGFKPADAEARMIRLKDLTTQDSEIAVQFTPGAAEASEVLAAVIKRLSAGNDIRARWVNGQVQIVMVKEGTPETLDETAAALEIGEMYWLRGKIEDNAVKAEIWKQDPTKFDGGEPLFTAEVTLEGENAETFGESVEGHAALTWEGLDEDWIVRQVRVNELGLNIPDNTLRVTIPYTEESSNILDVALLLRAITPANTAIQIFTDSGFILGVSLLGEQGF